MHIYLYFFFCVRRRRLESPLNKVWSSGRPLKLGSCPSLTREKYTIYGVTDYAGPRADAPESHGPNASSISQLCCSKQVFMHSKPFDLPTYCIASDPIFQIFLIDNVVCGYRTCVTVPNVFY